MGSGGGPLALDDLAREGEALPATGTSAERGIGVAWRGSTGTRRSPDILLADRVAHADNHEPLPIRWEEANAIQNDLQ